jgi:hypothetical protein
LLINLLVTGTTKSFAGNTSGCSEGSGIFKLNLDPTIQSLHINFIILTQEFIMDFASLKDQVSNLTLYDIKAGVRKVQNGQEIHLPWQL